MEPKTYRKMPVEIQAMRFADVNDGSIVANWCGGSNEGNPEVIVIKTLEGDMRADLGDWIIRGVKGEFYPCKPDIFEATYEVVL